MHKDNNSHKDTPTMRKLYLFVIIAILSIAFMPACSKMGGQKSAGSGYVAKVGSTIITEEDVKKELSTLAPHIQRIFAAPDGMERFVDELVKREVLYQEAKKEGLEGKPEYKKKVEDFKKLTLISLLLEKKVEDKAKVTEKDVKEYYETHKQDLATNTQIRASHILLKTEEEANAVRKQLNKGGDFAKIAKEKSLDSGSAKNGGDLGFFSRGQMVPEFERAAFSLNVGEVSNPVKTQFGYHIIKVTDKKQGPAAEFEKVKDALTQRVTAGRQKEVFDNYLNGLKKTYSIEIRKDAIANLGIPPKSEGTALKPDEGASQPEKQEPKGK
jgi:peptidyl-prolyl cis-trans isomerase C